MSDSNSLTAEELMSRMMKKELFVILNTAVVSAAELRGNLKAHLDYLISLEKQGVLFASGPLFASGGEMTGEGLTIIRAGSYEEAKKIAAADPFVVAGQRTPVVKRWIVNEGRISVTVDISDCTVSLV